MAFFKNDGLELDEGEKSVEAATQEFLWKISAESGCIFSQNWIDIQEIQDTAAHTSLPLTHLRNQGKGRISSLELDCRPVAVPTAFSAGNSPSSSQAGSDGGGDAGGDHFHDHGQFSFFIS